LSELKEATAAADGIDQMLVALAACVALATVIITGGRLAELALVRLRHSYLVPLALGAQIMVVSLVPGSFEGLHKPVHIATYAALAAFLWSNRHLPGLVIIAVGAAGNAAAITANGGVMPASAAALARAGMPADKGTEFANSAAMESAKLSWLGDVFAVPASWPISNVFSIGDLLIAIGLTTTLHWCCQSRLAICAARLRRKTRQVLTDRLGPRPGGAPSSRSQATSARGTHRVTTGAAPEHPARQQMPLTDAEPSAT
jgi:hypothetical protein